MQHSRPIPAKPYSRWTEDTERAFLLALRLCGQVTRAAQEIGRSTTSAYGRRNRDPAFARAWDEAVAAQQAEWIEARQRGLAPAQDPETGGGRLAPWRQRRDGWDAPKRRIFLRTLALTKDVRAACAAAKISSTAAYRLRSASPPFARAWEKALGRAVQSIEEAAYRRAVLGWDEVVTRDGVEVRRVRRFSDSLLRALLQARTASAVRNERAERDAGRGWGGSRMAVPTASGRVSRYASKEETDAALLRNLDGLEARVRRRLQAEQAAEAVRWMEGWRDWGIRAVQADPLLLAAPAEDEEGGDA